MMKFSSLIGWFGAVCVVLFFFATDEIKARAEEGPERSKNQHALIEQLIRVEEDFGVSISRARESLDIARSLVDKSDSAAAGTLYAFEQLITLSHLGNVSITADQILRDGWFTTEQKLLVLLTLYRRTQWYSARNEHQGEVCRAIEKLLPDCNHPRLKTICEVSLLWRKTIPLTTKELEALRNHVLEQHRVQPSSDSALIIEFSRVWTKRKTADFESAVETLVQRCEDEQRHQLGYLVLANTRSFIDQGKSSRLDDWQNRLVSKTENQWLIYVTRSKLGRYLNRNRKYSQSLDCLAPLLEMNIHKFAETGIKYAVLSELNHAARQVGDKRLIKRTRPEIQNAKFVSMENGQLRQKHTGVIEGLLKRWASQGSQDQIQQDLAKTHELLKQQQSELSKVQDSYAKTASELKKLIIEADEQKALAAESIVKRQEAERKRAELEQSFDDIIGERESITELARAHARAATWIAIVTAAFCLALIGCIILLRKNRQAEGQIEKQEANLDQLNVKLARMKRMDSLGLMAGSIAHDFNNILVGVSGNAEVIELSHKRGKFTEDFMLDRVAAIKAAAGRAQKLAKQMLDYAGKQYIAHTTSDVNRLVAGYEAIFESFCKDGHEVQIQLANKKLFAKVDETQIEQAILNLVTNAISVSMPDQKIFVRTFQVTLGDEIANDSSYFCSRQTGGNFCCIEIEDFGTGIPEHQLQKIFEPYYSESGTGRGLGLAVVHGIIESHNGLIRCESTYGKGTRFQLLLPQVSPAQEDSIDGYLPETESKLDERYEGKRVLVIDDELSVLDACEQLAQQFGLAPTCVHIKGEHSIKAILEAFSEYTFDCVLMDVVMPELNATQILDVMKDREIPTPVILMSGFTPERLDFYQKRESVVKVLAKPFGAGQLVDAFAMAIELESSAVDTTPSLKPPKFHSGKLTEEKSDA